MVPNSVDVGLESGTCPKIARSILPRKDIVQGHGSPGGGKVGGVGKDIKPGDDINHMIHAGKVTIAVAI